MKRQRPTTSLLGGVMLASLGALLLATLPAAAVDLRARTTSSSKQFTIYCEDAHLRGRVAGFVEEVKGNVYGTLGLTPWGRIPIVVTLEPGHAAKPARVSLVQTPEGPSIQVYVKIGDDPAAVHLEKHIIRALLLDFMYRDRPHPEAGTVYTQPPWWVVSAMIESSHRREQGLESDIFRRLVDTNKLPPIEQFLTAGDQELGPTAEAFDATCAMALLQLLLEQPDGRTRLATLVRTWPDSYEDPVAALKKSFPNLAESGSSLQKWWTVNLARYAASDRYRGLTAEETEKQLSELLEFDVVTDKKGTRERFHLAQFAEFMKKPGGREATKQQRLEVVKLGAQAHPLLGPVVNGYEQILFQLSRGKTHGVSARIAQVQTYCDTVLHRRGEIGDYLNWFEATQLGTRSNAFDSYLFTARSIEREKMQSAASMQIAQYLDLLQEEFKPIQPR